MICARKRHALQPLPAYFLSDLDLAQTVTLPASQEPAQPGSPLASAGAPDTDDVIASDHQYSITGCIDQALRDRIRQLEELASANEKLRKDNDRLQKENEALRKKVAHLEEMYDKAEEVIDATIPFQNFTLTAVQQDPKKLAFYTGFDSLERFLAFYKFVQAGYEAHKESQGPQRRSPYLSMDDQLLLVLSRLRVGLLEQDLAYRFRIHISTVSRLSRRPDMKRIRRRSLDEREMLLQEALSLLLSLYLLQQKPPTWHDYVTSKPCMMEAKPNGRQLRNNAALTRFLPEGISIYNFVEFTFRLVARAMLFRYRFMLAMFAKNRCVGWRFLVEAARSFVRL
ncbi:uncharacterized protein ISCGN_011702 [Ixodes scapularis]